MSKQEMHQAAIHWTIVFAFIWLVGLAIGCRQSKTSDQLASTVNLVPDSIYLKNGNRIVSRTFDTLRNSLLNAIQMNDLTGAISFCNESAYSLTNTYADSIRIRRTSLRFRNPGNKPDSLEAAVLNEMEALTISGKAPPVKIVRGQANSEVHFFKPILMQAMCLNCHGSTEIQIQKPVLTQIRQLYPADSAVNFSEGELRGAWHIIFKE